MSIHHHKHEARDGRLRFVQIYHEDLDALAELGPSSLLVYSFLAKYANYSTGQCFPSIDTLATDCNVSRNTVMKAIQKLSDAGLIAVEKERTDHGYDRSIYTVLSKTDTPRCKNVTGPGSNSGPGPVQKLDPNDNQLNDTQKNKIDHDRLDETFETFWKAYPNKTEKKRAREQWHKIRPDQELTKKIMASVTAHMFTQKWKDGYVKAAFRWLRDENYNDDLRESSTPAAQSSYQSGPTYITAEPPGYEGLLRMREEARRKGRLP